MRGSLSIVFVASLLGCASASGQDAKPLAPATEAPATAVESAPAHPLEGLWELRMERTVWWPHLVPGSLVVSRGPNGLRASLTFDPMWGIDPKPLAMEPVAGDASRFSLAFSPGETLATVEGTVRDGVFVGEIDWAGAEPPEKCFISASRLAPLRRFEPDSFSDALPIEPDPSRVGIDAAALDRILLYAERYDTDALLVVKDGHLVCDRTFLRPRSLCDTDALTMGIASLAIPLLVEDGKLPRELDVPLITWFPEWKSDARKSRITLRHVLTHTSGLAGYAATTAGSDYLALSANCAAVREPGTVFEYNSQAIELLSGVIAKAAGEQADTYLDRRLFRPLGITRWQWARDGAGNVPTYGNLELGGQDLARIGSMLADRGRWQDKQVVPQWWVDEMAAPSALNEEMGLVWSLLRDPRTETVVQTQAKLDRLKLDGYADAARLAPLVGKSFESRFAWWKAAGDLLGRDGATALYAHLPHPAVGGELRGPVSWMFLRGTNGQYLLVSPAQHLAVVRNRRGFAEKELPADIAQRAGFGDLPALVQDLVW